MFKIICSILLILVMGGTVSASAVEIDLTEFAAGGASTHSHIYSQKYDSSNHWEECKLCGSVINKNAHTLSTSYTKGEGSCAPGNYRMGNA